MLNDKKKRINNTRFLANFSKTVAKATGKRIAMCPLVTLETDINVSEAYD